MSEKKQLNVRIPLELAEEIDKDGMPKVDIVVDALKLYFDSKKRLDAINAIGIDSSTGKTGSFDSNNSNNNDSSDNSNTIEIDSNAIKIDSINGRTDSFDRSGILRMQSEIEFLRLKVDDLLKLLHQEQVLHIQTQRVLNAPETQNTIKKWWQFWR